MSISILDFGFWILDLDFIRVIRVIRGWVPSSFMSLRVIRGFSS